MSFKDNLFTKLITVNSSNRVIGSDAKFEVDLGNVGNDENIVRCELVSLSMVNSQYNIVNPTGAVSSTFEMVHSVAGAISVPVPNGQYSFESLRVFLKTAIDSAITTDTWDMAIVNGYLVQFTVTGAGTAIYPSVSGLLGDINKQLGVTVNSANLAVVVADSMINLSGLKTIFLRSNKLASDHGIESFEGGTTSAGTTNLFCTIPLDASFGSILHFVPNEDNQYSIDYLEPKKFDNIDLVLTNSNGRELLVPANQDIHMTLKIYMFS